MIRKPTKTVEAKAAKSHRETASSTAFVPHTRLGRRLWEIRRRFVAGGQRLLDWEDVEEELRVRRGEAGRED
jgi:hypothetical protein